MYQYIKEHQNRTIQKAREINNRNKTTDASPAEQVKQMKELLDMGIITEEEFEKKKKELLGL